MAAGLLGRHFFVRLFARGTERQKLAEINLAFNSKLGLQAADEHAAECCRLSDECV